MKFKVGDLVRSALRKEFGLVMRVRPPVDATIEPVCMFCMPVAEQGIGSSLT